MFPRQGSPRCLGKTYPDFFLDIPTPTKTKRPQFPGVSVGGGA